MFLDANENPYGILNRYPDPNQKDLKNKLSVYKKLPIENIFIGNGSDEVMDLIVRVFCNPGIDWRFSHKQCCHPIRCPARLR